MVKQGLDAACLTCAHAKVSMTLARSSCSTTKASSADAAASLAYSGHTTTPQASRALASASKSKVASASDSHDPTDSPAKYIIRSSSPPFKAFLGWVKLDALKSRNTLLCSFSFATHLQQVALLMVDLINAQGPAAQKCSLDGLACQSERQLQHSSGSALGSWQQLLPGSCSDRLHATG